MFAKKSLNVLYAGIYCMALFVLVLAGCSSRSTLDDTAGNSGTSIVLTASPTLISANGTTVIDATVTVDGTATADQIVTFTVSPVIGGTFSASIDTTDANGSAGTTFTATTTGSITITATISGSGTQQTLQLNVGEGAANIGIISTDYMTYTMLGNGIDVTNIVVTIKDSDGNNAPDNTMIRVIAGERFVDVNKDGLWTEGTDSLVYDLNNNGTWDAIGTISATAFTSGGTVTVPYVASAESGTSYVLLTVDDNNIQASVEVTVLLVANSSIDADPDKTLLLANGIDVATFTMTVKDGLDSAVADGTVIQLVAGEEFRDVDGNGRWSVGTDELTGDANNNNVWDSYGSIPTSVTTTSGVATFQFTAGSEPATVYIKMTVVDLGMTSSIDYAIPMIADTSINSIFLMTDSMQIAVTQTGGMEVATIFATGYDITGRKVGAGVPINFHIIDQPGGVTFNDAGTGPFLTYTDAQGVASTQVHSGTFAGTVKIRASSGTVLSEASYILVSAGPPAHIVIGSEDCNVPYWDNVGEEVAIIAIVSDQWLNPVNDSTVVYFSTDEGTMKSHQERTKDWKGKATSTWLSGNNVVTADGIVWIYAETAGGTVLDSTFFYNSHSAATLTISGWQTQMTANGSDNFWITVDAVDLNGNYVIDGTVFKGDASHMTAVGGTFADGCYSASERVKVVSKVLTKDYSLSGGNDDGIGAIDMATYWVKGGGSVTAICTLLTAGTSTDLSKIDGQTAAAVGETITFKVIIKDRFSNPLGDHTLNATATGANPVVGATQTTDEYGEATGFSWTAPGIGDFTITVSDTDPRGLVDLILKVKVE